jgi:hypothetical protein
MFILYAMSYIFLFEFIFLSNPVKRGLLHLWVLTLTCYFCLSYHSSVTAAFQLCMLDFMASIFLDFHQILYLIIMNRVTDFAAESKM